MRYLSKKSWQIRGKWHTLVRAQGFSLGRSECNERETSQGSRGIGNPSLYRILQKGLPMPSPHLAERHVLFFMPIPQLAGWPGFSFKQIAVNLYQRTHTVLKTIQHITRLSCLPQCPVLTVIIEERTGIERVEEMAGVDILILSSTS